MKVSLKGLPDALRGIAWPTSARVVRCAVKSVNERDPCHLLLIIPPGVMHSDGTARDKCEEGAVNVRSVWSESPGLHAGDNGRDNRVRHREVKLIPEPRSQFGLRAATRPHEAGISSSRKLASFGEYVPAPCTHRPSNHLSDFRMRGYLMVSSNPYFARGVKL